jgi:hypothetical protein
MTDDEMIATILRMVAQVEKDEVSRRVFSTGQQIAIAFVLNRKDWLNEMAYGDMLAAIERLGPQWFRAAQQAWLIRKSA